MTYLNDGYRITEVELMTNTNETYPRAQPDEKEQNLVAHPSHYSVGMPDGVEVIDVIRSQGGSWELSNAIKYVLRAQFKGNYTQDLRKAIQYLEWEVENGASNSDQPTQRRLRS